MISLCSAVTSVANYLHAFKASLKATARRVLAEAFQAPARDNPAGRPAWALGNRAVVGQAAQVAEPGNPALGELFQDLRSFVPSF